MNLFGYQIWCLFYTRKIQNKIYLVLYPFQFDKSSQRERIYESQNLIKWVKLDREGNILIVDENKFIKVWSLEYAKHKTGN